MSALNGMQLEQLANFRLILHCVAGDTKHRRPINQYLAYFQIQEMTRLIIIIIIIISLIILAN